MIVSYDTWLHSEDRPADPAAYHVQVLIHYKGSLSLRFSKSKARKTIKCNLCIVIDS